MRQLLLTNEIVGPVFTVPVCGFYSNRKKQPITQIKRSYYPIWVIYPRMGTNNLNTGYGTKSSLLQFFK